MVSKKPQLRRCGNCGRIGHNKATCNNQIITSKHNSGPSPLKFFIHHVNIEPPTSPHVVNLKSSHDDIWKKIETSAPDNKTKSILSSEIKVVKNGELEIPLKNSTSSELDFNFEQPFPKPKLFSELKTNRRPRLLKNRKIRIPKIPGLKIPKFPDLEIKKNAKAILSHKAFALSIAFFALTFTVPGIARGYFESLNLTKETILNNGTAGFMNLQESTVAIKSGNILEAKKSTDNALEKFNLALQTLESKHTILQNIISIIPYFSGEFISREKVLLGGQQITVGNSYLLAGVKLLEEKPERKLTEKLNILSEVLSVARPNYEKALENLESIENDTLPFEYQDKFTEYRNLLSLIVKEFKNFSQLSDTLQEIFGGKGTRRYLLVFQNPHELRPTGGFVGSFAVIDIKDGEIINLDIPAGGSYDLKGQLPEYLIPPLPLTMTNKRWEFQDSNWFPDFPTSAEKMLWFFNKSRNLTADGVIAINSSVLERVLGIIGPVQDSERGLTFSADTAIIELQKIVEEGPEKKNNKPKQVITDLAPQILTGIKSTPGKSILPLLAALNSALQEKEIQAYFTSSETQEHINSLGWGGKLLETAATSDYLMVVNANIQGEKSDAKIIQSISHQAIVNKDGSVLNTVIISREHTGIPDEKFYGKPNVNYLRIYVPEGSKLISANGFSWPDEKNFRAPDNWSKYDDFLLDKEVQIGIDEKTGTRITKEFQKTVFGNWIVTKPGEISRVQFTYELPFKVFETKINNSLIEKSNFLSTPTSKYQLVVQKQSGITSEFESRIIFPTSWHPIWNEGKNLILASNGTSLKNHALKKDSIWSILMKSN